MVDAGARDGHVSGPISTSTDASFVHDDTAHAAAADQVDLVAPTAGRRKDRQPDAAPNLMRVSSRL